MEKGLIILGIALLALVSATFVLYISQTGAGKTGFASPSPTQTLPSSATPSASAQQTPTAQTGPPGPTPTISLTAQPAPSVQATQPQFTPTPVGTVTEQDITSFEVLTDKEAYAEREKMQITVRIVAAREIPAVNVSLKGIVNRWGYSYLAQQETVQLPAGESTHNYSFTLPSCSSCSGLSYGAYNFTVAISYDDVILKSITKTIEIRSA